MTHREQRILILAKLDPTRCDDVELALVRFACRLYRGDDEAVSYVLRVLSRAVAAAPHMNKS